MEPSSRPQTAWPRFLFVAVFLFASLSLFFRVDQPRLFAPAPSATPTPAAPHATPTPTATPPPSLISVDTLAGLTAVQSFQFGEEYNFILESATLSPDGTRLAIATYDQTVEVWDLYQQKRLFQSLGREPIAFSSDNKQLAFIVPTHEEMAQLEIWDWERTEKIRCFSIQEPVALIFSPDGQKLFSTDEEATLTISSWTVTDATNTSRTIPCADSGFYNDSVTLYLHPEQTLVSMPGNNGSILWNLNSGECLSNPDKNSYENATVNSDWTFLASKHAIEGLPEASIQILDPLQSQIYYSIQPHLKYIQDLAFNVDGRVLAISGEEGVIEFWDVWEHSPLTSIRTGSSATIMIRFSADGGSFFTLDATGHVVLWRTPLQTQQTARNPEKMPPSLTLPKEDESAEIEEIPGEPFGANTIDDGWAVSPDGSVGIYIDQNVLYWYDLPSLTFKGKIPLELEAPSTNHVVFSPNSQMAIVRDDFGVLLVGLSTSFENHFLFGDEFTFSHDSQRILVYRNDSMRTGTNIWIYDIPSQSTLWSDPQGNGLEHPYPINDEPLCAPAFSPNGQLFAAGNSLGNVFIWNSETGKVLFKLKGHIQNINSVAFNPDGTLLASASEDASIRLWNTQTGQWVTTLAGFPNGITGVSFSADGKNLVVKIKDAGMQQVNLATGEHRPYAQPLSTLRPEEARWLTFLNQRNLLVGYPLYLAFSSDGRYVAQGSDTNILIWDVETNQQVIALEPALIQPSIASLTFSSDNQRLMALGETGGVWIWELSAGKIIFHEETQLAKIAYTYQPPLSASTLLAYPELDTHEQFAALAPNGQKVAITRGLLVEIWDIETQRKTRTLEPLSAEKIPTRLSFSADSQRLYAGVNLNQTAAIWNTITGALISEISLPAHDLQAGTISALHENQFARVNSDGQTYWLELWDLDTRQMIQLSASLSKITDITISPDHNRVYALCEYQRQCIWDVPTASLQKCFPNFSSNYSTNPDGSIFIFYGRTINGQINATKTDSNKIIPLPDYSNDLESQIPEYSWPFAEKPTYSLSNIDEHIIAPHNAHLVKQLAEFHQGSIQDVNWSTERQDLIIGGATQAGLYLSQESYTPLASVKIPGGNITSVRITGIAPLAAGTINQSAAIWNILASEAERPIAQWATEADADNEVKYRPVLSPDGHRLAYQAENKHWRILNIAEQRVEMELLDSYRSFNHLVFSQDGSRIAATNSLPYYYYQKTNLRVWDLNTGNVIATVGNEDWDIGDYTFTPDGKTLVGASGGSVWFWPVSYNGQARRIEIYPVGKTNSSDVDEALITAVSVSANGQWVAAGTNQNEILLFNTDTLELVQTLSISNTVKMLRFSPDGLSLLAVDVDGLIAIWDVTTGERTNSIEAYAGDLGGLSLLDDGSLAAWGSRNLWKLSLPDLDLLQTTRVDAGNILAISPNEKWLAVNTPYHVTLYDAATSQPLQVLEGEAPEILPFASWIDWIERGFFAAEFNADNSELATHAFCKTFIHHLTSTGQAQLDESIDELLPEQTLEANERHVLSPNGQWEGILYNQTSPKTFTLKQIDSSLPIGEMALEEGQWQTTLQFHPSLPLAAVGFENGHVVLVDLTTMQPAATLAAHTGEVQQLLFSSDGKHLITRGADGVIRVWGLP